MAAGRSLPLAVSTDGSHFVDHAGVPVYWLGDTQWELVRAFSLEDAKEVLTRRRDQGFNVLLVMLLGVGASGNADGQCDGRYANAYGERPWLNDDPLTPNEGYFANVDAVVSCANEIGVVLVLGLYHARTDPKNPIQLTNARAWARWVGSRYRDAPNLIWSMYPASEPASLPMVRELAEGLREGDGGRHLITVHPDPSPASSSQVFHREEWLGFNTIQTFRLVERIVPMVTADTTLVPRKPVVMAEGAYEGGIEYGFAVTPLWIRRQAYFTCLAGGSHCYGHNDCWRVWPAWKQALSAPGATQMGILRKVLTDRSEWWRMVPDPAIVEEDALQGDTLILAARHPHWRWAIAYLAGRSECRVRIRQLRAQGCLTASWIDPRTGEELPIDLRGLGESLPVSTPADWEDALLVLEAR
jgi:hypothetical protein